MDIIDERPRDPIQSLSGETFSRLLSFLEPQSLQSSSLVNKSWRRFIQENINNQEQDDAIPTPFLAIPATTELSLDLASFFPLLPDEEDAVSVAMKRIKSSLRPLRDTMESISFALEPKDWRNGTFELIVLLIKLLSTLPQLVKLEFKVPSPVSVKSHITSNGGRTFILASNDKEKVKGEDGATFVVSLIKEAEAFVGSGLTEFLLPGRKEDEWNQEIVENAGLLSVLSRSRPTLKRLDLGLLGVKGKLLWEFFIKCPHLTSLSIFSYSIISSERTESERDSAELSVPEQDRLERKAILKKLHLRGGHNVIKWDEFLSWIGDRGLRFLNISGERVPSRTLATMLLNSQSSLKSITLKGISTDKPAFYPYSRFLLFPNLTFLHLATSSTFIYLFFRDLAAANLSTLRIEYEAPLEKEYRREKDNIATFFKCLIDILHLNGRNLTDLKIDYSSASPNQPKGTKPDYDLKFSRLEKLDFGQGIKDQNFAYWLSQYDYPSLKSLAGVETYLQREFEKRAPNLPKIQLSEEEEERLEDESWDPESEWWILDDQEELGWNSKRRKNRQYCDDSDYGEEDDSEDDSQDEELKKLDWSFDNF